jgi:tetratricopeptide (TPR) repeat protein
VVARRLGDPSRIAFYATNCAGGAVPLERARAYAEFAMESIRRVGASRETVYVMTTLAGIRLLQGEGDPARHFMEECLSLAGQTGQLNEVAWAHYHLAQDDLLNGRAEAARARLTSALDDARFEDEPALKFRFLQQLVWVDLELGAIADAQDAFTALEAQARGELHGGRRFVWLLRKGMLLTHVGRWKEAEGCFHEAKEILGPTPFPYFGANALRECGVLLAREGAYDQAREHLSKARDTYRSLGAPLHVRWVERTLEGLAFDAGAGDALDEETLSKDVEDQNRDDHDHRACHDLRPEGRELERVVLETDRKGEHVVGTRDEAGHQEGIPVALELEDT